MCNPSQGFYRSSKSQLPTANEVMEIAENYFSFRGNSHRDHFFATSMEARKDPAQSLEEFARAVLARYGRPKPTDEESVPLSPRVVTDSQIRSSLALCARLANSVDLLTSAAAEHEVFSARLDDLAALAVWACDDRDYRPAGAYPADHSPCVNYLELHKRSKLDDKAKVDRNHSITARHRTY